jgi:hypothetical protein
MAITATIPRLQEHESDRLSPASYLADAKIAASSPLATRPNISGGTLCLLNRRRRLEQNANETRCFEYSGSSRCGREVKQ